MARLADDESGRCHRACEGTMKPRTCRHVGMWSWFTPLNKGTTRLFCGHCGKWLDEIRSKSAHADATRLAEMLGFRLGYKSKVTK